MYCLLLHVTSTPLGNSRLHTVAFYELAFRSAKSDFTNPGCVCGIISSFTIFYYLDDWFYYRDTIDPVRMRGYSDAWLPIQT